MQETISHEQYRKLHVRARSQRADLRTLRYIATAARLGASGESRSEEELQVACVAWALDRGYPYNLIYSVPNESDGSRMYSARLKLMGRVAGQPDLHLPYASGEYTSLYVELKYGENDVTERQDARMRALARAGHASIVLYTLEQFRTFLLEYVNAPGNFVPDYAFGQF